MASFTLVERDVPKLIKASLIRILEDKTMEI